MSNGRPRRLTEICQRNGCADLALVLPRLMIPVRGHPELKPLDVLLDIRVCRAHFAALAVHDYLTKLVRGGAKHAMHRVGVEPDFEGAFLRPVHIMCAEVLHLDKQKRGEAPLDGAVIVFDGGRGLAETVH